MAQEAAAQLKNDAWTILGDRHEARKKLPSLIDLRKMLKDSPGAVAVGRAKQAQYAIADAHAMYASFRSNFFDWVKDPSSRQGKPRPPRWYRRGKRTRIRYDYQDLTLDGTLVYLPDSAGLPPIRLVERDGTPILSEGDRLVEVRVEPARSRRYVFVDFVVRRKGHEVTVVPPGPGTMLSGNLFIDLGVARLVTCLDDRNLFAFFVSGGPAKAILARGAKWHAKLRREAALGVRHGKARAGALAARSARQMEDLMQKGALLVISYAISRNLARVVVGRNKGWKQEVDMGKRNNQLFAFIPHEKLIAILRTKCRRAGIQFVETEESFTSKTDHLALEPMGEKPENYSWLGSRSPRGCFRSSVGIVLQSDVNGCLGLGRKVGGNEWIVDLRKRLGEATGTRLVPRNIQINGSNLPVPCPGERSPRPRGQSSRAWISTKVALAKIGAPPLSSGVAGATHSINQAFPKAA